MPATLQHPAATNPTPAQIGAAAASHIHEIDDVTNLQDELDVLSAHAIEDRIIARSVATTIAGNGTAQSVASITIPGNTLAVGDVIAIELMFRRTLGAAAATLVQSVAGTADSTGLGNGPCEIALIRMHITGTAVSATIESNMQTVLGGGRSMAVPTGVNLASAVTLSWTINPATGINYSVGPAMVRRVR
jgi:hypothetical protein